MTSRHPSTSTPLVNALELTHTPYSMTRTAQGKGLGPGLGQHQHQHHPHAPLNKHHSLHSSNNNNNNTPNVVGLGMGGGMGRGVGGGGYCPPSPMMSPNGLPIMMMVGSDGKVPYTHCSEYVTATHSIHIPYQYILLINPNKPLYQPTPSTPPLPPPLHQQPLVSPSSYGPHHNPHHSMYMMGMPAMSGQPPAAASAAMYYPQGNTPIYPHPLTDTHTIPIYRHKHTPYQHTTTAHATQPMIIVM